MQSKQKKEKQKLGVLTWSETFCEAAFTKWLKNNVTIAGN